MSAAWLLLGDAGKTETRSTLATKHKHDCTANIQSAVLLLKSDPNNLDLINMVEDCIASMKAKATKG